MKCKSINKKKRPKYKLEKYSISRKQRKYENEANKTTEIVLT